MTDLIITEIAIEPVDNKSGLIGFTNFVINNDFKICGVGIYSCPAASTGIRLTFPHKEYKGAHLNTVFPIHNACYETVAVAVANAYRELMSKLR